MTDGKPDLGLSVGEAARRSGVAVSTLHFYEAKGLIRSARTRGNQRRYPRSILRRPSMVPTEGEAEEFVPARRQALEVDEHWGCWQPCPAPRPALWDQPAGLPPKHLADQSFPPTSVALFHASQV